MLDTCSILTQYACCLPAASSCVPAPVPAPVAAGMCGVQSTCATVTAASSERWPPIQRSEAGGNDKGSCLPACGRARCRRLPYGTAAFSCVPASADSVAVWPLLSDHRHLHCALYRLYCRLIPALLIAHVRPHCTAFLPARYIHDDPGLVPLLEMLRRSGKKLFVATNSLVRGCWAPVGVMLCCTVPKGRWRSPALPPLV